MRDEGSEGVGGLYGSGKGSRREGKGRIIFLFGLIYALWMSGKEERKI